MAPHPVPSSRPAPEGHGETGRDVRRQSVSQTLSTPRHVHLLAFKGHWEHVFLRLPASWRQWVPWKQGPQKGRSSGT